MESAPASPIPIDPAIFRSDSDTTAPRQDSAQPSGLPRVRVSIRLKITLPYALLALAFAMGAAYVVSRVVLESIEDRFKNQLVGTGKLTADLMVGEENRLLETFRLLAFLQGMPEAMVARDAEQLRTLALPIAVNSGEEAVEILDLQGTSLLSLRHRTGGNVEEYSFSQGDNTYLQWEFVQNVLAGRVERDQNDRQRDKYAGLARAPWGDYFYVSGPVLDASSELVGAILVGKSLSTLTGEIRSQTQAITTIYSLDGQPMASSTSLLVGDAFVTTEQVSEILARQQAGSLTRQVTVASVNYKEILGAWEARGGDDLGVIGAALAPNFITRASRVTRIQIFLLVNLAFLLVIAVGVYLANRITQPLLQMVRASWEVARGNLNVKVDPESNDEVAILAHSFNNMVSGLQEGSLYRDLLGRTVSPEVREQLRANFASGDLRLEGQETVATVLMSDIRGFTALAEKVAPTTILTWLNEYFGELVPIITRHGGVVNRFDGDAVLAFFGILPHPLPPEQSARQACQAALEMLEAVELFNARREVQGEPPFVAGIGINTGPVTAGGLGSADRLHYTIIGDTVNTAQRLESSTRQFERGSIIVSENTACRLRQAGDEFHLEPLGAHTLKGKADELLIYRLWPCEAAGRDSAE